MTRAEALQKVDQVLAERLAEQLARMRADGADEEGIAWFVDEFDREAERVRAEAAQTIDIHLRTRPSLATVH